MIHPDGTMDVIAHDKLERRRYTHHQQVTQSCITQNIFIPEHGPDEVVSQVQGQLPRIYWKDSKRWNPNN